ncbi:restriction endonuclease subunit S [Marinobacter adhaerens]|uniref:restriction endonuclease subunit S n=1 Tax=Marinobacter adhaerens TaxID=1033846 RepID=UPI001E631696|nr:restriction endonuclease subunit S [Marinobacter adhaerens]MCD1647401.1 restriction endonuclease subunit S [Marinobacter adhaerens]
MDAKQFLAELGHFVEAPGGIGQLREMIYQLAVTGSLTRQLETDGDARVLLADVAATKNRLIREKSYKRLPKLESEAIGFPRTIQLPETWCWTRLIDIGEVNPRNDAPDDAAASFIPMSGLSQAHKGQLAPEASRWGTIKKGYTHFANRDVIVAKITPCFENGKAAVVQDLEHEIGAGTTELHVFRPIHAGILSGYIYLFLRSPYFTIEGRESMTGTAGQKRLPANYFATRAVPLPPTKEQSRIIAKVDELMALCDELEAQQQVRGKLQTNLRQATLQAVANAASPQELQTTWSRLAENFGLLYQVPNDVRQLRDVLHYLTLRGTLLPDTMLPKGGDAADAEFAPLPEGWKWSTLANLSEYITSGSRGWKAYMANQGDSFIRSQDIKHDALIFESPAFVNLPENVEGTRTLVRTSDLLLTITGGNVGRCATVPELSNRAYVSQHVALIRLREPGLSEFIYFWMINKFGGQAFLGRYIYGDKPGLNLSQVGSTPIPLPPIKLLPEILENLRRHQQICDRLSEQLSDKQDVATSLVSAAVSALTGMAIGQEEDEPLRAPQTELIAPLRLGETPDIKAQAPLAAILARHNGKMAAKDLWRRFGGSIDGFYTQLKTEVAHGWILEPEPGEMREKQNDTVSA